MMNGHHHQTQQQQYAIELNEHDVLCGRGSGPNDRVGNINFRNLVLSRKAEYLAAPSRDAKGRIATNIVATIRTRGGRFLKKLSAAQVKEAGFKRGKTVYEMADEPTVLEKAKQTLRQNRAEFVEQISKEGGEGLSTPSGETVASAVNKANNVVSSPKQINGGNNNIGGDGILPTTAKAQQHLQPNQVLSQQQIQPSQNGSNSACSLGGSLNPIALCDASAGLDSMQCPNLSARTAAHLNQTLFATSSNISSITNQSVNNSNNMMSLNSTGLNQPGVVGSSGLESGNYSIMSMNTADLCAAMGGSFNTHSSSSNSNNNMSLNSFEQSTSSAQAIGNLLQEYQSEEEKALMQQYEQLKAQQQVFLQQQQQEIPQQSFQPNMQYIPEEQQQLQFQAQQLKDHQHPPQQQRQQQQVEQQESPSDVFASLLKQYNTLEQNLATTQPQYKYKPKPKSKTPRVATQQQNQQPQSQQSNGVSNKNAPSNNDILPNSLERRLSYEDQNMLMQQFQQLQNTSCPDVLEKITVPLRDATQTLQLYNDYTKLLNDSRTQLNASSQQTQTQQKQNQQNQEWSSSQMTSYQDSSATLRMGSYQDSTSTLKKGSYQDSSATLKMGSLTNPSAPQKNGNSYLDSSALVKMGLSATSKGRSSHLDSSAPLKGEHSYQDSSAPLNDLHLTKKHSNNSLASQDYPPQTINTSQNNSRTRRRRGSRYSNTSRTSSTSGGTMGSLRLSNVEPADFTDESFRLSFLTANRLARTLDDMSTMSMDLKQSGTSNALTLKSTLDSSMLSLMSMSLSEIAPELSNSDVNYNSNGNQNEEKMAGIVKPPTPEISVVNEDSQEEIFGHSVMSLGVSLDEKHWDN